MKVTAPGISLAFQRANEGNKSEIVSIEFGCLGKTRGGGEGLCRLAVPRQEQAVSGLMTEA